jgi:four helix bundle protein
VEKVIGNKNLILDLSFDLAVEILKFSDHLKEIKEFEIANQILRCGTSIGANVREAQHPESRKDFYHKLKIAVKEAEETDYWIDLIEASGKAQIQDELRTKNKSVIKLLLKILSTTKANF